MAKDVEDAIRDRADDGESNSGILDDLEQEIASLADDVGTEEADERAERVGERAGYTVQPRDAYVDRLGEAVVSAVEDAVSSSPPAAIGAGAPRRAVSDLPVMFGGLDQQEITDAHRQLRSVLRDTIVSGEVGGVTVAFAPKRSCPVFAPKTNVPLIDNPLTRQTRRSAQTDVCVRTDGWIRANNPSPISRGTAGQLEAILAGLEPDSIARIREGLRETPSPVPKGYVTLTDDGGFDAQEGRNRAVAAKLEGEELINTTLIVVGDRKDRFV